MEPLQMLLTHKPYIIPKMGGPREIERFRQAMHTGEPALAVYFKTLMAWDDADFRDYYDIMNETSFPAIVQQSRHWAVELFNFCYLWKEFERTGMITFGE